MGRNPVGRRQAPPIVQAPSMEDNASLRKSLTFGDGRGSINIRDKGLACRGVAGVQYILETRD